MCVKPVAKPSASSTGLAHRPPSGEDRAVDVAQGDDLRADPLDLLADERPGPVLGDVVVDDPAVGADGVVRELLALDELLDVHLVRRGRGAAARLELLRRSSTR